MLAIRKPRVEHINTTMMSETKFPLPQHRNFYAALTHLTRREKSPPRQLPFSRLTLFFGMFSNDVLQRERRAHLPRLQLTTRDPALQRRSSSDRRATCGYDRGQPFYIGI